MLVINRLNPNSKHIPAFDDLVSSVKSLEHTLIRAATAVDLDAIVSGCPAHFAHEREHGAYTVFQEGGYPIRADAEVVLQAHGLNVAEIENPVLASLILHATQPAEYQPLHGPSGTPPEHTWVVHLLMVHPSLAGQGLGARMVRCGLDLAAAQGCTAVRLNTGAQNLPAVALYQKRGSQLVAQSNKRVGGAFAHANHLFFEKIL